MPSETRPRMLVSPQARPSGPGIPSLFSSTAMAFGLLPAAKARMLEQRGEIRLIAGDSVQRLGQHNIEQTALRVLQQRLDAGAAGSCWRPRWRRGDRCIRALIVVDRYEAVPLWFRTIRHAVKRA